MSQNNTEKCIELIKSHAFNPLQNLYTIITEANLGVPELHQVYNTIFNESVSPLSSDNETSTLQLYLALTEKFIEEEKKFLSKYWLQLTAASKYHVVMAENLDTWAKCYVYVVDNVNHEELAAAIKCLAEVHEKA